MQAMKRWGVTNNCGRYRVMLWGIIEYVRCWVGVGDSGMLCLTSIW